jgi:hybrid cluster-associated redox disulfide protein
MFSKEMSILEALQAHPKAREIFRQHGMACLSCMGAVEESIEAGANMHGINIDVLLKDLNSLAADNS